MVVGETDGEARTPDAGEEDPRHRGEDGDGAREGATDAGDWPSQAR